MRRGWVASIIGHLGECRLIVVQLQPTALEARLVRPPGVKTCKLRDVQRSVIMFTRATHSELTAIHADATRVVCRRILFTWTAAATVCGSCPHAQARSMHTGTGFSTKEELQVEDGVQRRILKLLLACTFSGLRQM